MNTYTAGDAWRNHIKQFEALDSWFNSLPEVTQLWLSQQIDIFAGKYPPLPNKEDIQPVPSKEQQKQSLVEIMEADQRDERRMCMSKLRSLLNDYGGEQISISKFLEEINNHFLIEQNPDPQNTTK